MITSQQSKDGTKRIFDSIDRNTFNKHFNFSFTNNYYEEAHNIMVSIGLYLFRYHSVSILKYFSPMGKERTQHTSWYKEIENFVLVKESMVGNILQDILHEWMLEDIPEENLSEEIS